MKKQSIVLMLAALSISLTAQPLETSSTTPFFSGNLERAQALASNEGKLYFLYFSASWCMPCQWMEENTFSDPALKEYVAENYLAIKIDLDSPEGQIYRQSYQVKTLPTILIFNSQGQLLQKYEEAIPVSEFLATLQSFDKIVHRLKVAVPIPPPAIEEALPKETITTLQPPPLPTISDESENHPSLLPDPPPTLAKPVITPTKEYGNLPEEESSSPPPTTFENEGFDLSPAFGVQLGAFSQVENANRMINRLESRINAPLRLWQIERNGKKMYKVIAGGFEEKFEAISLQAQLKQQSIKGFVQILNEHGLR